MTDMPDEIWANGNSDSGGWFSIPFNSLAGKPATQYTRADTALARQEAAVRAERVACASLLAANADKINEPYGKVLLNTYSEAILMRTPTTDKDGS